MTLCSVSCTWTSISCASTAFPVALSNAIFFLEAGNPVLGLAVVLFNHSNKLSNRSLNLEFCPLHYNGIPRAVLFFRILTLSKSAAINFK